MWFEQVYLIVNPKNAGLFLHKNRFLDNEDTFIMLRDITSKKNLADNNGSFTILPHQNIFYETSDNNVFSGGFVACRPLQRRNVAAFSA
jgi:hypothetical protein